MKLRKNDTVIVTAGKDKGKEGKIERVYSLQDKVLVPDINMYKKHVKRTEKTPEGGIVSIPRALNVAKVAFKCPKCGKIARIGYKIEKDKKFRICKKCNQVI